MIQPTVPHSHYIAVAESLEKAAKRRIAMGRRLIEMVDRVKADADKNRFDGVSPLGGFEWACDQILDELYEMFPEAINEINEEFYAKCRAVAERYNQLRPDTPVEFVQTNTTFRTAGDRRVYHKSEIEQIIKTLEQ